jgi:hypothetical protein
MNEPKSPWESRRGAFTQFIVGAAGHSSTLRCPLFGPSLIASQSLTLARGTYQEL